MSERSDSLMMETWFAPREALSGFGGFHTRHFFEMGRTGSLQKSRESVTRCTMFTKLNHKLCFRCSSLPSRVVHTLVVVLWNLPTPPKCGQMPGTEAGAGGFPVRDFGPGVLHCLAPHRMLCVFILGRKPQNHLPGNGFSTQPEERLATGCWACVRPKKL